MNRINEQLKCSNLLKKIFSIFKINPGLELNKRISERDKCEQPPVQPGVEVLWCSFQAHSGLGERQNHIFNYFYTLLTGENNPNENSNH